MINKELENCDLAVSEVFDGASIMLGGFGNAGMPGQLIEALIRKSVKNLTIISNGAGTGPFALGTLFSKGFVKKLIASYPAPTAEGFRDRFQKGEVELELVPQGSLVERIRCGGNGIGAFYTPTAAGTELAEGKEIRVIDGRDHVLEFALKADFVFLKAHLGDRFGNLSYRGTMRNFNMVMATAGKTVIAEVDRMVPAGDIAPDDVHTPGIFVDSLVEVNRLPQLLALPKDGA
jgi:3-oxoadipate CoA-transferase alpha subunit